jgi:hypothetical protein
MKIDSHTAYQFFFHPLSEEHSLAVKTLSVITVIALSILTAGLYLAVFLTLNSCENSKPSAQVVQSYAVKNSPSGFVGIEALKSKLQDHLAKLQTLASNGEWEHLREHTTHPDSGFDWWMFPTDRASAGQGDKYKLSLPDILALKADPAFMANYRKGVQLVLLSWGWDASSDRSVENAHQRWTNYQVRLGKMINSLSLFGEKELLLSVKKFCDEKRITPTLELWIRRYL